MYTSRYDLQQCKKIGLKGSKLQVLDYIVEWMQGGNAQFIIINDVPMYWINVKHMSESLDISYSMCVKALRYLKENNLIDKDYRFGKEGKVTNKLYVALNYQEYFKLIVDNEYNRSRYCWTERKLKETEMIFEEFEVLKSETEKKADELARNILTKYNCYFKHRIPAEDCSCPTKTYTQICTVIKDIYSGNFTNPRLYKFSSEFLGKVSGWQDKINAVRRDWNKVSELIFSALTNFELMHNKNRMPYSKKYLQKNLSLWFYDIFTTGEGQSQFILCLEEPEFIASHNSEIKADKIYSELPVAVKVAGNKLYDLNKTMYAGMFWENIKSLYEWCQVAFSHERGMLYWLGEPENIVNKFFDYCSEKNISISTATVNIRKAVETSGPLVWFIKDACSNYDMNPELADCASIKEIESLYNEVERRESVCF